MPIFCKATCRGPHETCGASQNRNRKCRGWCACSRTCPCSAVECCRIQTALLFIRLLYATGSLINGPSHWHSSCLGNHQEASLVPGITSWAHNTGDWRSWARTLPSQETSAGRIGASLQSSAVGKWRTACTGLKPTFTSHSFCCSTCNPG